MKIKFILFCSITLMLLGTTQPLPAQEICSTCPGNKVSGIQSSAFGLSNTVEANYSFVAGRESVIKQGNHHGNIIGSYSKIDGGFHSIVIGSFSSATNDFSYVFGPYSKARGSLSFALGAYVEARSGGSFIIGNSADTTRFINNISNSLMIGFGSRLPTLFVEKAPFSLDHDRTGRIGIGNVTAPQAKLHIRADQYDDASILLEATGSNKRSSILMAGGQAVIGTVSQNHSLSFVTGTSNTRMFINAESGNIGVGSEEPVAKFQVKDGDIFIEDINRGIIMKSPDGRCWRGMMNNFGQLEFTEIPDCIISSTNAQTLQPGLGVTISPNPVSDRLEVECRLIGAEARLMNLSGIEISSHPLQQGASFIPVHDLKPGMYLLNIVMQGKGLVETHKFVKQ